MKVVLADDERLAREGLINLVPWAAHGLVVVGVARNGVEALELARKEHPQLMVVDIRMPIMDGLELVKRVRSELPDTSVIIISAHDEFDYARTALQYGAVDYVLKPFSVSEIESALERAVDSHIHGAIDRRHETFSAEVQHGAWSRNGSFRDSMLEVLRTEYARDLRLSEMAERGGMSVSRFCEVFKETFGSAFHETLTRYRMEIAEELLRDPSLRINEVADRVGYVDARHFGRLFKRIHGVAPSDFRKKPSAADRLGR